MSTLQGPGGKPMDCETARSLFSPRADGELEGRERAELDRHLAGCPPCRAEWEAYAGFLGRLSAGVRAAADLYEPTAQQRAPEEEARGAARPPVSGVRILLPAAALAAAAVTVLLLLPARREVPPDPQNPWLQTRRGAECEWRPVTGLDPAELPWDDLVQLTRIDPDFALQELAVPTSETCGKRLMYRYQTPEGPLVLEQAQTDAPEACAYEPVDLPDFQGCLIPPEGAAAPEVTWYAAGLRYTLTAPLPRARIIELARQIQEAGRS